MRDQIRRLGSNFPQGLHKRLDRLDRASDVVSLCAFKGTLQGEQEGGGDVADILQVLQPAVADPVRQAGRDRLDRLSWLTRHAEIATDSVNRPGAKSDARNPLVEPVNLGIQLVANLVGSVVREWSEPDFISYRSRRTAFAGPMDRRRTGVNHALDLAFQGRGGFKHGERADHVDRGAEDGIGATRRGLQAGKVQDMAGLDALDRLTERGGVGDVSLDEVDFRTLLAFQQKVDPVGVFLEVVNPNLASGLDQLLGDPGTDATVSTRHQYSHEALLSKTDRQSRVSQMAKPMISTLNPIEYKGDAPFSVIPNTGLGERGKIVA